MVLLSEYWQYCVSTYIFPIVVLRSQIFALSQMYLAPASPIAYFGPAPTLYSWERSIYRSTQDKNFVGHVYCQIPKLP